MLAGFDRHLRPGVGRPLHPIQRSLEAHTLHALELADEVIVPLHERLAL